MGSTSKDEGPKDQFPVGMRVLAVDPNPTFLNWLEDTLLRCQYKVTTAPDAITALKELRENKDKFDLVISDVEMPEMDGFKLLEHVNREIDIPMIMLSDNSENRTVMRAMTLGACDYLLKPVRIEVLGNIWQHVIRKRMSEGMKHSSQHKGNSNAATSQTAVQLRRSPRLQARRKSS